MKQALIFLIRLYQKTISPDHGVLRARYPYGYCRFYPTCSEYAIEALERRSFAYSLGLIASRLVRCHPWSQGGVDPVRDIPDSVSSSWNFFQKMIFYRKQNNGQISNGVDHVSSSR
jgi:putative membrane protein insertion efficiency factor